LAQGGGAFKGLKPNWRGFTKGGVSKFGGQRIKWGAKFFIGERFSLLNQVLKERGS